MVILPAVAEIFGPVEFDPDALHRKYLEERDKRLDAGPRVYTDVTADVSGNVDDPYVEPGFTRESVRDEVRFALIGAGFGSLLMGAKLRDAGFDSLRIIDSAGDVGGTWYWNRYPGAACDTESYCYMPLLEETGYIPKHKYEFAPDILEHAKRIARRYRLYDDALFQTSVTGLTWDEQSKRWIVKTDRGDEFKAQYVCMANGPLNRPKLPAIAGIHDFKGHMFHTNRWDYDYTGGDSTGNPVKLNDKRVGIIGTGATAIQCIPHLGEWAKQLYVFQRTPSCVDIRANRETDATWAASLQPGWQRHRMANFNAILEGYNEEEDLVNDGWTTLFRSTMGPALKAAAVKLGRPLTGRERSQLLELFDYKNMNRIRDRVEQIVKDKATAESLKPWYRQFCKRACFHDAYLQTFNRPSVTLVDTQGKGVERLTQSGVVANGREYPLDCLIFATGFESETTYTHRAGYDVIGRGGVKLSQHWAAGLRTFQGVTADGFPNCFFLGRTQTGASLNMLLGLDHQTTHVAYMVSEARTRGHDVLEPSPEAVKDYVTEIRRLARKGERFWSECTPGFYNNEGDTKKKIGYFSESYGGGAKRFFEILDEWRRNGSMRGMMTR
jgi:cation diffusion facilitator CzcD-associated flavoprotein CzcO